MANERIIRFHVDLGPEVGLGHAVRCGAVAQALQRRGISVRCSCPAGQEALLERAIGFSASPDGGEPAFLDGYRFAASEVERLAPVAVFDDNGTLAPPDAVIFNGNLHASTNLYQGVPAERLRLGTSYAPLRSTFAAVEPSAEEPNGPVLLCLGGADSEGWTEQMVELLRRVTDAPLEVILGAATLDVEPRARDLSTKPDVSVRVAERDMPGRLLGARWAVLSGGGLLLEAARCGLPAAVLVIAENQVSAAMAYEDQGLGTRLGDARDWDPATARQRLRNFALDADFRAKARRLGPERVDGLGAERIAEEVASLLSPRGRS